MTIASQIIWIEEIDTMLIPLSRNTIIEFHNIALAANCNLNLISLSKLQESRITYHNNPTIITLMRSGKIIANGKKNHNLFTLDLVTPSQVM